MNWLVIFSYIANPNICLSRGRKSNAYPQATNSSYPFFIQLGSLSTRPSNLLGFLASPACIYIAEVDIAVMPLRHLLSIQVAEMTRYSST